MRAGAGILPMMVSNMPVANPHTKPSRSMKFESLEYHPRFQRNLRDIVPFFDRHFSRRRYHLGTNKDQISMTRFKQDSIEFNLLLSSVFAFLGINRDEDVNFFRVTNVGASLGNCCYGIVIGGLNGNGCIYHY